MFIISLICSSGILEQLSWVVLVQSLSQEVAVKLLANAALIWKFDWSWRMHFQISSSPPVIRMPQSLANRSALGCLSVLTTWQPASLRVSHSRGSKMEVSIFSYYLALEVIFQNHFLKVLVVTQVIPIYCVKGVCQGVDARRWNIFEAVSEAIYYTHSLCLK